MIYTTFLRKNGFEISLEKGDVETKCRLFETVSLNGSPNFCHRVRGETILWENWNLPSNYKEAASRRLPVYCLGDALRTTLSHGSISRIFSILPLFFLNSVFPLLPFCRFNLFSPGHSGIIDSSWIGLQIQKTNCWRGEKNLVPEIYFRKKKGCRAVCIVGNTK